MSDDTHYDVLGVAPGASKDAIKTAYQERLQDAQQAQAREAASKRPNDAALGSARETEASVRAAWQVLSDPYQRGRYDASIDVPDTGDPAGIGGDAEVVDEDDGNGNGNGARQLTPRQKTAADRRAARAEAMANRPPGMLSPERPPTPKSWPSNVHPPPNRARVLAMGVDLIVLAVLLILQQTAGTAVLDQIYPKESKRADTLQTQIDNAQTQKDKADACVSLAASKRDGAATCSVRLALEKKTSGRLQPNATALATKKQAQTASKDLQTAIDKANSQHDKVVSDMVPGQLALSLGVVIIALLYLVPYSLRGGRRSARSCSKSTR